MHHALLQPRVCGAAAAMTLQSCCCFCRQCRCCPGDICRYQRFKATNIATAKPPQKCMQKDTAWNAANMQQQQLLLPLQLLLMLLLPLCRCETISTQHCPVFVWCRHVARQHQQRAAFLDLPQGHLAGTVQCTYRKRGQICHPHRGRGPPRQ